MKENVSGCFFLNTVYIIKTCRMYTVVSRYSFFLKFLLIWFNIFTA